jgi:hypothetical protein
MPPQCISVLVFKFKIDILILAISFLPQSSTYYCYSKYYTQQSTLNAKKLELSITSGCRYICS